VQIKILLIKFENRTIDEGPYLKFDTNFIKKKIKKIIIQIKSLKSIKELS
jgi:hypothetical protein